MLQSLNGLSGHAVRGKDGELGKVREFYFDDHDWVVRYLVLETGDWLDDRRLLLSPIALGKPDDGARLIPTELTREVVSKSPELSIDTLISRQQEIELFDYYQWPYYWGPATVSGVGPGNMLAAYPLIELGEEMQDESQQLQRDPDLRSTGEVFGYNIHARDGKIGNLEDFIIEDESWRIVYMIVDTGNWLFNKKVLVSPTWVEKVGWSDANVHIDLDRETIQNSPEYDPSVPLDRDFETRLYDHYGREKYW